MDCVCLPATGSRTAPMAWMRETAVSSPTTPSLLPPHLRAAELSLSFRDLPMGNSHYQHPGNSLAVLRWQGGCTGWASVPSRAASWAVAETNGDPIMQLPSSWLLATRLSPSAFCPGSHPRRNRADEGGEDQEEEGCEAGLGRPRVAEERTLCLPLLSRTLHCRGSDWSC